MAGSPPYLIDDVGAHTDCLVKMKEDELTEEVEKQEEARKNWACSSVG